MLKLVVFDLAGTTVADNGEVARSFIAAFSEHGLTLPPEKLQAVRGASKRQAIRQLLPNGINQDRLARSIHQAFRRNLESLWTGAVAPIAGAESAFRWLRQRGIRIAFTTGFDRSMAELLLELLDWTEERPLLVCGDDDGLRGRPAPDMILAAMAAGGVVDPRLVANVGDTTLDLAAGFNARVRWNVGVLTGAHSREQLESAPHTDILPSVATLPSLWAALETPNVQNTRNFIQ